MADTFPPAVIAAADQASAIVVQLMQWAHQDAHHGVNNGVKALELLVGLSNEDLINALTVASWRLADQVDCKAVNHD